MALPQQNEFDLARKRAQQQETAALQSQKDALARRAAQTGGGVNGALMKQEAVASDQSAQRLQSANEGIDTAQRLEDRRTREIEEGRKFQTGERVGAQEFQAGQAGQQRAFVTGERLGGQQFAAGETALERAQRQALQRDNQAFGERMFGLQRDADTSARADTQAFGERMFGLQRDAADTARADTQAFDERMFGLSRDATDAARADTQAFGERMFGLQSAADWKKFEAQLGFSREEFEQQKFVDGENIKIANQMLAQKGPIEGLFSGLGGGWKDLLSGIGKGSHDSGLSDFGGTLVDNLSSAFSFGG